MFLVNTFLPVLTLFQFSYDLGLTSIWPVLSIFAQYWIFLIIFYSLDFSLPYQCFLLHTFSLILTHCSFFCYFEPVNFLTSILTVTCIIHFCPIFDFPNRIFQFWFFFTLPVFFTSYFFYLFWTIVSYLYFLHYFGHTVFLLFDFFSLILMEFFVIPIICCFLLFDYFYSIPF